MSSGLIPLRYNYRWARGNFVEVADFTELADKTSEWANRTHLNLGQLALDIGGTTYEFNNTGNRSQTVPILTRLSQLEIGSTQIGVSNIGLDLSDPSRAKIVSADGSDLSSSNPLTVVINSTASPGEVKIYSVTANVTIALTGAHWGVDGGGDLSNAYLVLVVADSGSAPIFGVAFKTGRIQGTAADFVTVPSSASTEDKILVASALGVDAVLMEVAFLQADFDDTGNPGGENYWSIDSVQPIRFREPLIDTFFKVNHLGQAIMDLDFTFQATHTTNAVWTMDNFSTVAAAGTVLRLRTAATTAGDPFALFTVTGGSSWYAGIDNSDSDQFYIGDGSTVGTNRVVGLTHAGVGVNSLSVINDTANPSSQARLQASVSAGSLGGDPQLILNISGVRSYYLGVDNSDSDILKLGNGTAVGTDAMMYFDAANNVVRFLSITDAGVTNLVVDHSDGTYNNLSASHGLRLQVNRASGTLTAADFNTAGEMQLPAVDPPTANYANRNSMVKAWARVSGAGVDEGSYNVSSTTQTGTGAYTVAWDRDFSSANYACTVTAAQGTVSTRAIGTFLASTDVDILIDDTSGAAQDTRFTVIAIGTQ